MNVNEKGFTLIELLAVIMILAVISIIAIPLITNIINKANKSTFKDKAYALIKAGELYYSEQELKSNEISEEKIFDLPKDINTSTGLKFKGEAPKGTLKIKKNGDIALAISNERYCIIKKYSDRDVTVTKDLANCNIPEEPKTLEEVVTDLSDVEGSNGEFGIASCVTYGILCEPGTALAIQVNDDNTYKFLVLNDDGEKVTLIMAEDLGEPVAWINESHYESLRKTSDDKFTMYGPITALEALKTRTSDWTNLTEYSYTLDYGFEPYSGEYVQNVRARMLQRSDISSFSEFNDELNHDFLPIWLLGDFNEEYWLSDSCGSDDEEADCAYRLEQVPIEEVAAAYLYSEDRLFSSFAGLRPVITINK